MKKYEVSWDIDIEADGPVEAAKEALECMRGAGSEATVFRVVDAKTKISHLVDGDTGKVM